MWEQQHIANWCTDSGTEILEGKGTGGSVARIIHSKHGLIDTVGRRGHVTLCICAVVPSNAWPYIL